MNTYYWHITDYDPSGRWEGCQSVAREQIGRYHETNHCTCPTFDDDFDGHQDHAAACSSCSVHGAAVQS